MIQVVNDKGNVLAHINVNVIRSFKQVRSLVNQVGGQDPVYDTLFIVLVKLGKPAGK